MAGVQNPSKRHHYVPKGYLKNFTNEHGHLSGYVKPSLSSFSQAKPKDLAVENNFYTSIFRVNSTEIETRLNREFESPLLLVINQLISQVRLVNAELIDKLIITPDEKRALAKFAVLQLVRSKHMRDSVLASAPKYITSGMTLDAATLGKEGHLRVLEEHMNDGFRRLSDILLCHRISFLTTTRLHPYWTSDDPVTLTRAVTNGKVGWGGVGLVDKNLELYLPLSWDIMLVFAGPYIGRPIPYVTKTSPEEVNERNRLIFSAAHKYAFSPRPITSPLNHS